MILLHVDQRLLNVIRIILWNIVIQGYSSLENQEKSENLVVQRNVGEFSKIRSLLYDFSVMCTICGRMCLLMERTMFTLHNQRYSS